MEVFPYSWNTYEENGCLGIRIFGLNAKNENVFILVNDFNPYVYLELPPQASNYSRKQLERSFQLKWVWSHTAAES